MGSKRYVEISGKTYRLLVNIIGALFFIGIGYAVHLYQITSKVQSLEMNLKQELQEMQASNAQMEKLISSNDKHSTITGPYTALANEQSSQVKLQDDNARIAKSAYPHNTGALLRLADFVAPLAILCGLFVFSFFLLYLNENRLAKAHPSMHTRR